MKNMFPCNSCMEKTTLNVVSEKEAAVPFCLSVSLSVETLSLCSLESLPLHLFNLLICFLFGDFHILWSYIHSLSRCSECRSVMIHV